MYGPDVRRGRIDAFRVQLLRGDGVPHSEQSAISRNGVAQFGRRLLHSGEFQGGEESDEAVSMLHGPYLLH